MISPYILSDVFSSKLQLLGKVEKRKRNFIRQKEKNTVDLSYRVALKDLFSDTDVCLGNGFSPFLSFSLTQTCRGIHILYKSVGWSTLVVIHLLQNVW